MDPLRGGAVRVLGARGSSASLTLRPGSADPSGVPGCTGGYPPASRLEDLASLRLLLWHSFVKMNIEGYKYCGPFNKMNKGRAKNLFDEECRLHDEMYTRYGRLKQPYFYWSSADERLLNHLENNPRDDRTSRWAYRYFNAKKKYAPVMYEEHKGYEPNKCSKQTFADFAHSRKGLKSNLHHKRSQSTALIPYSNKMDIDEPRRFIKKMYGKRTGAKRAVRRYKRAVRRGAPKARRARRSARVYVRAKRQLSMRRKRRGKRPELIKFLSFTQKPVVWKNSRFFHIDSVTPNVTTTRMLGDLYTPAGGSGYMMGIAASRNFRTVVLNDLNNALVASDLQGNYLFPTQGAPRGYIFYKNKVSALISNATNVPLNIWITKYKAIGDIDRAGAAPYNVTASNPLAEFVATQTDPLVFPYFSSGVAQPATYSEIKGELKTRGAWNPTAFKVTSPLWKVSTKKHMILQPEQSIRVMISKKRLHQMDYYNDINSANQTIWAKKGDKCTSLSFCGVDVVGSKRAVLSALPYLGITPGGLNIEYFYSTEVWMPLRIDAGNPFENTPTRMFFQPPVSADLWAESDPTNLETFSELNAKQAVAENVP